MTMEKSLFGICSVWRFHKENMTPERRPQTDFSDSFVCSRYCYRENSVRTPPLHFLLIVVEKSVVIAVVIVSVTVIVSVIVSVIVVSLVLSSFHRIILSSYLII